MIQSSKRIHILFCVDQISVSSTSNNIFTLMLKCLLESSGLGFEELGRKLINMGCDGSNVFKVIELVRPNNFFFKKPHYWVGFIVLPIRLIMWWSFIRPKPNALAKGHFANFVCLFCSQPKEVCGVSKACWLIEHEKK